MRFVDVYSGFRVWFTGKLFCVCEFNALGFGVHGDSFGGLYL